MTGKPSQSTIHLTMGHVVSLSCAVIVASAFGVLPETLAPAAAFAAMVAILAMFMTRKTDEWISSLWTAGSSAGFIGAMAWLLFLPFLEGLLDGLRGDAAAQDIPASAASIVALTCSAIAHVGKRLRGF